jgi:tRNA-specific 2-thiouridylase
MTHVVVGMSGGVDSSVSALLLQQQGYQLTGVFMKNWEEDDDTEYCTAAADLADAQAVCDTLGIELKTINFAAEYWDHVFEYFLAEYRSGRTPNPDILCNREIKFKAFLDYARYLGADYMATGHYVRKQEVGDCTQLLKGDDTSKDQSYFLYALKQAQIAATLFPVGKLPKPQVRQLAQQHKLITHDKKDSTGICFIGERKFRDFLSQYLPAQPGKIVDDHGNIVGEHQGLMYYTIGQRQGLGIGGIANTDDAPWYVVGKDIDSNQLVVVQGSNHPLLFTSSLIAEQLTWVADQPPDQTFVATAKIRYRQQDQTCRVSITHDQAKVEFTQPQRAVTPGQSIVFYQGEVCLGGGIII